MGFFFLDSVLERGEEGFVLVLIDLLGNQECPKSFIRRHRRLNYYCNMDINQDPCHRIRIEENDVVRKWSILMSRCIGGEPVGAFGVFDK